MSQQLDVLFHKISLADPLCEIASSLIEKAVNTRLEFENVDEKILGFLTWQNIDQGITTNLLKIQESHKEILFAEWETQLIKGERAISRARAIMKNLVVLINDSLYAANLISNCIPGKIPKVKEIEKQWKHDLSNKYQQSSAIQGITWDAFWFYLVKPHSQQMTLRCHRLYDSRTVGCHIYQPYAFPVESSS